MHICNLCHPNICTFLCPWIKCALNQNVKVAFSTRFNFYADHFCIFKRIIIPDQMKFKRETLAGSNLGFYVYSYSWLHKITISWSKIAFFNKPCLKLVKSLSNELDRLVLNQPPGSKQATYQSFQMNVS